MLTKDFSIFTKMVDITKEQKIDYKIFYSYRTRNTTSKNTELYNLILCSTLYTISFNGNLNIEDSKAIQNFLQENDCINLECDIKINNNQIELC